MRTPSPESVQDVPAADAPRVARRHYRGVTYDKRSGTWRVRISCLGLQHHVGRYNDQEEAAQMYDKIAYTLYGDAAITNFGVAAAAANDCQVPAHVLALRHKLNAFKWQVQQLQRASGGAAPTPGCPRPPPGGAGPSRHSVPTGAAAGAQPETLLTPASAAALAHLPSMAPQQMQVPGMQPQQPLGAFGGTPALQGGPVSHPQQMGWVHAYSMPAYTPTQPQQQLVFIGGMPQQPHPQYPLLMGGAHPSMQPAMLPAGTSIAMQPGGAAGLPSTSLGPAAGSYYNLASPGQMVFMAAPSGAPPAAPGVSPFQAVAAAAAAAAAAGPGGAHLAHANVSSDQASGAYLAGVTGGMVSPVTGFPAGTFMAFGEEGMQGQVDVLQLIQALDNRQPSGASSHSSASTQLQLSPSFWGLTPPSAGSMESVSALPAMSAPGMGVMQMTSTTMGFSSPPAAPGAAGVSQAGLLSSFALLQLSAAQNQQEVVFHQAGPGGSPHQLPVAPHQLPAVALSAGWPAPAITTGDSSNMAAGAWHYAASSPELAAHQVIPAQLLMQPPASTPTTW